MKFTATAADLRDALERVSKVVPKSPAEVVYTGVRLRVRDGALTLTGSAEGDTTVTVTVPVTAAAAGDKVAQPKPILTFLAALPPTTQVNVSADTGPDLTVQPGTSTPYTFRALVATFPNTTVPAAHTHDVDLAGLHTAVRGVKDAAAKNRVVQVVSHPDCVHLRATDGLRLARAVLPGVTFGEFSGLLPLDVLEQICDIGATQVAVDRRGRVFTASSDKVTIVARVVDELFPNVDSVLDDPPQSSVLIPARPTMQALARLASVADKRPIVVAVRGDEMTLSSPQSAGPGSGGERVELESPASGEITFAVNLNFLRDALAAHPADVVQLHWSSPLHPVFIDSTDLVHVTTVVMPVKF